MTIDRFIAEVTLDAHRSILVYHRQHSGRQYIRWRLFHKHRRGGNWYPDKWRAFVIPVGIGDALGRAIAAAVNGQAVTPKPAWLAAIDDYRAKTLLKLVDLNAPPVYLVREQRRRVRAWGLGPSTMPPLWGKRRSRRGSSRP